MDAIIKQTVRAIRQQPPTWDLRVEMKATELMAAGVDPSSALQDAEDWVTYTYGPRP